MVLIGKTGMSFVISVNGAIAVLDEDSFIAVACAMLELTGVPDTEDEPVVTHTVH